MCRPQIGTDAHRLGRYGIPVIHTQPIAHPNFCGFREFRGRFFTASNSVRSVDSVGKPTHPNHLCRSVKSVGEPTHPNHLCLSVKSVGEHEYSHRIRRTHRTFWLRLPPTDCTDFHRLGGYGIPAIPTQPIAHHNFCGFREFRGRFFSASNSVRSVDSVGKPTQPNHLCRSVKSVGEHEYSHRIRRTHRTFWLRWASHRLHRFSL